MPSICNRFTRPCAICSIAFNQPTPILDGNVIRVLTRVFGIAENPKEKEANARLWTIAVTLVSFAKDAKAALGAHFDCNRRRCLPTAGDTPRLAGWWTRRQPSADDMAEELRGDGVAVNALWPRTVIATAALQSADVVASDTPAQPPAGTPAETTTVP